MMIPKIIIKNHKKHHKRPKEPTLTSDPIRNLVTQRPHFSFALPSTVNLTKLNVFAARPELLYNTTSSRLAYKKTTVRRGPIDDDSNDGSAIRRPSPPLAPPTFFKVDSAVQDVMASRTLVDQEASSFQAPQEAFVDAETENEIDRRRRKHRIYAATVSYTHLTLPTNREV